MSNFKEWLSLIEGKAEYPGRIDLPPNVANPIKDWFTEAFMKLVYNTIILEMPKFRQKSKELQSKLSQEPKIDIAKIRSDISWDMYINHEKGDMEDAVQKRIHSEKQRFKQEYAYNHRIFNQMRDLIKYLQSHNIGQDDLFINNLLEKNQPYIKEFPIDITGWRYENILKKKIKNKRAYKRLFEPIVVAMTKDGNNSYLQYSNAAGGYSKLNNSIAINMGHFTRGINSVQYFQEKLSDLTSTIEHELVHWMQTKVLDEFGFAKEDEPGELLVPGWDYSTDDPDYYEKYNKNYLASKKEIPAQLVDAIAKFKSEYLNDDSMNLPEKIKYFTGELGNGNPFFTALKRYKPDAWRRMVSVFYKEISKMPQLKKVNAGSSSYFPVINTSRVQNRKPTGTFQ